MWVDGWMEQRRGQKSRKGAAASSPQDRTAMALREEGQAGSRVPFVARAHRSRCACSGGECSPPGRSSRSRPGGCGNGGRRAAPLRGPPGTRQCLGGGR